MPQFDLAILCFQNVNILFIGIGYGLYIYISSLFSYIYKIISNIYFRVVLINVLHIYFIQSIISRSYFFSTYKIKKMEILKSVEEWESNLILDV